MKDLPTIVASRRGECALELIAFEGREPVPNRDAVAFLYVIRLAPGTDPHMLAVIFSGTVFHISTEAFGLPDYQDRVKNFSAFALAAIGDYLDDSGPPTYADALRIPQLECFSSHFQAWSERDRVPDHVIDTYIASHLYWSWKFGHETWTAGPADVLRLRSDMKNTSRLIRVGEGQDWSVVSRSDDAITLEPSSQFLRRLKQGFRAPQTPAPLKELDQMPQEQPPERPGFVYVDEVRIADLKRLEQKRWDLRKLVALCEELNVCYRSQCHHAVAALTRAVLDHVPPIFGFKSFGEVASNYAGTKSFKDCMQRLEGAARKIADGHLHTPIRSSESLPTRTQVNFTNEIDVLLAEVVRVLS